ncbi:MAG TPA: hypothetical protein DIW31_09320 [Bacteroidales bacterium]|nr:hypothetical protein [Bacteroidales bacterium]
MKDANNISNRSDDCISTDVLVKYVKGELSGYEKNMVERHIASCEICSDELEGLSLLKKPERIDEITLDLHRKVDAILHKPYKEIPYLRLNIQVAATVLILIGVSAFYFFVIYKPPQLTYNEVAAMELEDIASSAKGRKDTLVLSSYDVVKKESGLVRIEDMDAVASLKYTAPIVVDSVTVENNNIEILDDRVVAKVAEEENVNDEKQVVAESSVLYAPVSASKKSIAAGNARESRTKLGSKDETLSYSDRVQAAMRLYEKKKYEAALNAFNLIISEFSSNDSILFSKSVCYYHLTRFDEAISILKYLIENPQTELFDEARWYYALSLIGAQKRDEAIVILEQLIDDNSSHKRDAKRELSRLKRNQ